MSLLQTLKNIRLDARKNDAKLYATLSNVIGTVELKSKLVDNLQRPEDELVIEVVNKEISQLKEQASTLVDPVEINDIFRAANILKGVIPAKLSTEEISGLINEKASEDMSFPDFMKFMKTNHFGLYNGGEVSKMAKAILK